MFLPANAFGKFIQRIAARSENCAPQLCIEHVRLTIKLQDTATNLILTTWVRTAAGEILHLGEQCVYLGIACASDWSVAEERIVRCIDASCSRLAQQLLMFGDGLARAVGLLGIVE